MAVRTFLDDFTTAWDYLDDRGSHLLNNPQDVMGRLETLWFSHTQGATLGDIGSTQGLLYIDAGPFRFLQGRFNNSAWGTSRTLNIGWQASTQNDGTVIAASLAGLVSAKDVSAALTLWDFNVVTSQVVLNPSKPLGIISTVAGGTIPAGATLSGWIQIARP